MQDTSTDYEELAGSIQAGYFIKQGIANYNEDLFLYVGVRDRVSTDLRRTDVAQAADDRYAQVYGYVCQRLRFSAGGRPAHGDAVSADIPKLEKKSKRNVLTSGAASTYMFTSFEMSDDTGVLLGN